MKQFVFLCLCFFVLASQATAISPSHSQVPAKLVADFYGVYIKLGVSGLPDAKQSDMLKPFLSDGLNKILVAARRKQAEEMKRHPNDKPPWDDGDIFSSLFEGADRYKVSAAIVSEKTATVPVQLEHGDNKSVVRWTDTFVLTLENNEWRIADIKMGGQWQFKQGTSLLSILAMQ